MKKCFLWLLIMSGFIFSNIGASYSLGYKSGYNNPILGKINFSAYYNNGRVETNWSAFTPSDNEHFKYYKVVRSETNKNPVYPEDKYIKYTKNINETSYVDKSPKSAYYRVCAITSERDRYCSNVVWVKVSAEYKKEQKQEYKKEYKNEKKYEQPKKVEKKYKEDQTLSSKTKTKLKAWVNKLESKLKNSTLKAQQKVQKIEEIEKKLKQMEQKSQSFHSIVNYLLPKLEAMREQFAHDDLSDLDDLLEGLLD